MDGVKAKPFYSTDHLSRPVASKLVLEAKESLQPSLKRPTRPFTPHHSKTKNSLLLNADINNIPKVIRHLEPITPKQNKVKADEASTTVDGEKHLEYLEKLKEVKVDSQEWRQLIQLLVQIVNQQDKTFDPLIQCFQEMRWLRTIPKTNQTEYQTEKEHRQLIIQYLYHWSLETSDVNYNSIIQSLILYLSRDDKILSSTLSSLFRITLNQTPFHIFIIESLNHFLNLNLKNSSHLFGKRCHLIIFVIGVFRNLSENQYTKELMVDINLGKSLKSIIVLMMNEINDDLNEHNFMQASQLLIQSIGTISNLITYTALHEHLVSFNSDAKDCHSKCVLQMLCEILQSDNRCRKVDELILTVIRFLSKISEYPKLCSYLELPTTIKSYFSLLVEYSNNSPLYQEAISRLCFIMSNLTCSLNSIHDTIFQYLDDLIAVFGSLTEKFLLDSELIEFERSDVDVIIKMIRLISNTALHPPSGLRLVNMTELEMLIDFDKFDQKVHSELLLNMVGCIANVSFYFNSESLLYIHINQSISKFIPLLMNSNHEIVIEVLRTAANLTRFDLNLPTLVHKHLTQVICLLLDHDNEDILFYSCGILINMLKKYPIKSILLDCDGPQKLFEVLELAIIKKLWNLANVAAQGIYNLKCICKDDDIDVKEMIAVFSLQIKSMICPALIF
ncbi:hypothetical protein BC833DRAFT_611055 [Globomyces pollinis-pini]|nr:hypothetical protein BC833DRAFT_611055 [Globomyces pollinis-pini]